MARALKHPERLLPNGILLKSHEFDPEKDKGAAKNKFRHWTAEKGGVLYGEFRSWQKSLYHVSEKEYGRNGGTYSSVMVKESWIEPFAPFLSMPLPRQLDHERRFWTWVKQLKASEFLEYFQDVTVKPRDDSVVETVWPGVYMQVGAALASNDGWSGLSGFDPDIAALQAWAPATREDAEAFGPIAAEGWPEYEQESPDPEQPAA